MNVDPFFSLSFIPLSLSTTSLSFQVRTPSSPPPLPGHDAVATTPKENVYVSPLPESAVAAAAKAAGEITATTAAAFGLPSAASSAAAYLRGGASSSSSSSKLPLPSVGLPKTPRAETQSEKEYEHAGETQQAFFDRVLLDRVEAIVSVSSADVSSSSSSLSSSSPPPPAPLAAKAVRAAAAHAWAGYVAHAWGEDELAPLSRGGKEAFCSLAVTAVDALDTLLLMGMHKEFHRARAWLLENLPGRLRGPCAVSVFEATIRVVGGLASAADLSGDGGGGGGGGCGGGENGAAATASAHSFTASSSSAAAAAAAAAAPAACSSLGDLAALAAEALLPAFNVAYPQQNDAGPRRGSNNSNSIRRLALPVSEVELGTGEPLAADVAAFGPDGASGTALLAEAGSLGPEFWRAGYWRAASELKMSRKGRKESDDGGGGGGLSKARALAAAGASAVDAILAANDPLASADGEEGEGTPLPPTTLSLSDATAAWSERHTVGGRTDSYYEYLLKMWLMLRRAAAAEEEEAAAAAATAAAATAAAAGERDSSSSSSLASGFVRDKEAELEALSYISSSSSVPPEDEKRRRGHGHSHHHHHHREKGGPQTPPTMPTTPLARRAELYRRAWLAAVDEILEKLVRETPGGARYLTSDMGVRSCLFFFFLREREREREREEEKTETQKFQKKKKKNFLTGARHGTPRLFLPRKHRPGGHVRRRLRRGQQEQENDGQQQRRRKSRPRRRRQQRRRRRQQRGAPQINSREGEAIPRRRRRAGRDLRARRGGHRDGPGPGGRPLPARGEAWAPF